MESFYKNTYLFKKELYQYSDVKELHYKLLNILSLISFNYNRGQQLCPLCQIPVHFHGFEEELDQIQYVLLKLKQFAFKLYPFSMECYQIDKHSTEALVDIIITRLMINTQGKKVKFH